MKRNYLINIFFFSVFFYTASIGFSPIYPLFFTASLLLLFYNCQSNTIKIDGHFLIGTFSLVYSLVILSQVTDYGTYINFIYCGILIAFLPTLCISMDREQITLSKYFVFALLTLYGFEAIYRISNPIMTEAMLRSSNEALLFYQYKFNSIMFTDSNFVALSLLSFYCIIDEFLSSGKFKITVKTIIFVLLILTFSRAAYISFGLYFFLKNARLKYKIILLALLASATVFLIPLILSDGSYLSKLKIIDLYISYVSATDTLGFLIGAGIGRSYDVLGIGSHNLFVLLNIEYGFIGFLWFVICVVYNMYKSSFKTLPYWGAVILCGFSLGVLYPFIFLPALMTTYRNRVYVQR